MCRAQQPEPPAEPGGPEAAAAGPVQQPAAADGPDPAVPVPVSGPGKGQAPDCLQGAAQANHPESGTEAPAQDDAAGAADSGAAGRAQEGEVVEAYFPNFPFFFFCQRRR